MGEYQEVRDAALDRYHGLRLDGAEGAADWADVADSLRRAAVLAEALGAADRVMDGQPPIPGTTISVPEEQREGFAARGLQWALEGTDDRGGGPGKARA